MIAKIWQLFKNDKVIAKYDLIKNNPFYHLMEKIGDEKLTINFIKTKA